MAWKRSRAARCWKVDFRWRAALSPYLTSKAEEPARRMWWSPSRSFGSPSSLALRQRSRPMRRWSAFRIEGRSRAARLRAPGVGSHEVSSAPPARSRRPRRPSRAERSPRARARGIPANRQRSASVAGLSRRLDARARSFSSFEGRSVGPDRAAPSYPSPYPASPWPRPTIFSGRPPVDWKISRPRSSSAGSPTRRL